MILIDGGCDEFFAPEMQSELRRQGIIEDVAAIRLEEEAIKGNTLPQRVLAGLGEWMVARGEKLREKHSMKQMDYSELGKKAA